MCCQKVAFVWDHNRYNPRNYYQGYVRHWEEWVFIYKEGTVEEKISRVLKIMTTFTLRIYLSWKLCLNFCSLKWLRPSRSLIISLILLGLWQSKREFGEGLRKLSIFSLNTEILLEFLGLGSKSFHSIIAGIKEKNIFAEDPRWVSNVKLVLLINMALSEVALRKLNKRWSDRIDLEYQANLIIPYVILTKTWVNFVKNWEKLNWSCLFQKCKREVAGKSGCIWETMLVEWSIF